jgi:hypothetical protein
MARDLIDINVNLAERFVRLRIAGLWQIDEVSSQRTSGTGLRTVQS